MRGARVLVALFFFATSSTVFAATKAVLLFRSITNRSRKCRGNESSAGISN